VSDNGHGVDESLIHQLTEPFFRVSQSQMPSSKASENINTEGLGLGLSIASKVMRQLGGSLEIVKSNSGGLSVTLMFHSNLFFANQNT
jgi:signal transduction histidine kinase